MPPTAITVEPRGSNDFGPCDCCGNMSRTVWGWLYDGDEPVAGYWVHWTVGRVDHGANFDLIVGEWGEGTSPRERSAVAVLLRWTPGGPQFMVIDAAGRPAAEPGGLAGTALRRDQVIGTPLAAEVFALLDAVWLQDERIAELARPGR